MAESCLLTDSGLDFTIHSAYSSCVCGPSVSFGQKKYVRSGHLNKITIPQKNRKISPHGGMWHFTEGCPEASTAVKP